MYPVINNTGPINQHHPYLILIYCKWENISKILLRNERKQRRYISSSCSASDMCGRSVWVCVIVRQADYSIRYREVWFMSLCLLSLASSAFSTYCMNMCIFFPGHLSGCCEYVRTEMMLNMTQERANSFKSWKCARYEMWSINSWLMVQPKDKHYHGID